MQVPGSQSPTGASPDVLYFVRFGCAGEELDMWSIEQVPSLSHLSWSFPTVELPSGYKDTRDNCIHARGTPKERKQPRRLSLKTRRMH